MLALITGASNGIGREIAKQLAKDGYDVIIHCNNDINSLSCLSEEIKLLGRKVYCFQMDFSKAYDVKNFCDGIKEHAGIPNLIVNNAGIALSKQIQDIKDEDFDKLMNINFKAIFIICREFSKEFIKRKSGVIINISSIWGQTGAAMESIYSASKGAVLCFTKSLASELGPSGIRVNCISPGCIDTRMNAGYSKNEKKELCERTPLERFGKADEIAKTVSFLASDKASFITGADITVDGGFSI